MLMNFHLIILTLCGSCCFVQIGFGQSIRIQNGTASAVSYRLALQNGRTWSELHQIEANGDQTIRSANPLRIRFDASASDGSKSYVINPGSVYRFNDQPGKVDLFRVPPRSTRKPVAEGSNVGPGVTESSGSENADQWDGPVRDITILALADTQYRRLFPAWQDRIKKIVAGASSRFKSEFGLGFTVLEYREWEYTATQQTSDQRWEQLLTVEPGRADLVVGFLGLGRYRTMTEGEAIPFAQHMLISDSHEFHLNRAKNSLIHELAHLFGAFHVADKRSIMQPRHEDVPIEFMFGPPERQAILLARNVDLSEGSESLTLDAIQSIRELYREHRHPDEPVTQDPIARSSLYRLLVKQRRDSASANADLVQQDRRSLSLPITIETRKRATLKAHADTVSSLAFSPDGKTLATVSFDGMLKLWEVASCEPLASVNGDTGKILCVGFTPDGKSVATASTSRRQFALGGVDHPTGEIKLWESRTGRELASFGEAEDLVLSLAFSPDGKTLATPGLKGVTLWDVHKQIRLAVLKHDMFVYSVAFSPDGTTLAVGGSFPSITLWDPAKQEERAIIQGHVENQTSPEGDVHYFYAVWALKFSPDGKTLASGSQDTTVKLWNTASSQKRLALQGHSDSVGSMAYMPGGRILATGRSGRRHTMQITRLRFADGSLTPPSGLTDIVFDMGMGGDQKKPDEVKLWDTRTGKELATIRARSPVAFSSDSKTLATGSDREGEVILWEVARVSD